jgi:hypothetical protein
LISIFYTPIVSSPYLILRYTTIQVLETIYNWL